MVTESSDASLDPITVEVVRNRLSGIAEEMQTTLLRSSFSPIVKEGLDASAGLFTPDGTTLSQACAIPAHLATLIPAIAEVLAVYPLRYMTPGDIYLLNDPYTGGTHLPDIAVMMPVFHNDTPIALSATMTHHQDVGGASAGSVPTNATEIFQEGLRLPAMQLRSGDQYNDTLVRILRQNVRVPDVFMGDLNAQIAACTVGSRRLDDLAGHYGDKHLTTIFNDLLDRSEKATREALLRLPDGTFHYVDYLDNDGIDLDQRIRIEVAVTIRDDSIEFDLTGSSPQVKGPMNCVPSGAQAAAYYAVRALTDPHIPDNGGCYRAVTVRLPLASVVNPSEPAAVNARGATMKRIASCMIGALAEALPERVPAVSGGELLVLALGGKRESDAKRFVVGELIASGAGGGPDRDGVDVVDTDVTNCRNLSVEAMEMEAPVRVHRVGLRCDSGGAGEYRGGLGVVREYEVLQDGITFSHRGERHFVPAPGLWGGQPGSLAHSVIYRADGREELIASKMVTVLNRGDRVKLETAGGGGFGDPRKRDRERVLRDVENGKVSMEAGERQYSLEMPQREDIHSNHVSHGRVAAATECCIARANLNHLPALGED